MAAIIHEPALTGEPEGLTPTIAVRYAWAGWIVLLALPALYLLYVLWHISGGGPGNEDVARQWFIGATAFMIVITPVSLFIRSRIFKSYWQGRRIAPKAYLMGMFTVWIAMELGGIISLTGCLMSRMLLPNMIPALVAFVLFIPLWPTGKSMVNARAGSAEDPEHYEEPR